MSTTRFTCLWVLAAGLGASACAEALLPDFLHQPGDAIPVVRVGAGKGLMSSRSDSEPALYLEGVAAIIPGRLAQPAGLSGLSAHWSPNAAQASSPQDHNPSELIDGLDALVPIGVSAAEYLALAVRVTANGNVVLPPYGASKAIDKSTSMQAAVDFVPGVGSFTAAGAKLAQRERWALPTLSAQFADYLLTAAALAIVAAAGLRLARPTRSRSRRRLVRI